MKSRRKRAKKKRPPAPRVMRRPVRRPRRRTPRVRRPVRRIRRRVRRTPRAGAGVPTTTQEAAAAALSIFKLSPPEPDARSLASRLERVLALLLPDFPDLALVTGGAPAAAVPPAVEARVDPFGEDAAFATDAGPAGAPPALAAEAGPPVAVAWEDDPAREELARVEDGTVLVNRLHPAYLRAQDSGELDGHLGLSLAWALSGYVLPENAREFIGAFLLRWADAEATSVQQPV